MISANTAKQQTEQNRNSLIKGELRYLKKRIKDSIAKGEFCVVIEKSIHKETVSVLKELSYNISVDSQYYRTYYNISWDK